MATREIPRTEWTTFFNRFSDQHERWQVNIEVDGVTAQGVNQPNQQEAGQMALQGISADEKDGENTISISVGRDGREQLTHAVIRPSHVWLEQSPQGIDQGLRIESREGTTRVSVRNPAR
ncbi:MAG: DUF5335 family protein [Anaerolineae bacterium]|nr:DUF5335 family protein [Anaerolineae bacterium]